LTGFYFKKNYFKNFISSQTQNTKIKMGTPGKGKKPGAPHNSPVEGKERKTTEENFIYQIASYLILALAHHHLDPHMRNP